MALDFTKSASKMPPRISLRPTARGGQSQPPAWKPPGQSGVLPSRSSSAPPERQLNFRKSVGGVMAEKDAAEKLRVEKILRPDTHNRLKFQCLGDAPNAMSTPRRSVFVSEERYQAALSEYNRRVLSEKRVIERALR